MVATRTKEHSSKCCPPAYAGMTRKENKEPRSFERGSKLLHLDSNQGQRD